MNRISTDDEKGTKGRWSPAVPALRSTGWRGRGSERGSRFGARDKETRHRLVTQMRPACFIAPLRGQADVDGEMVSRVLLPGALKSEQASELA